MILEMIFMVYPTIKNKLYTDEKETSIFSGAEDADLVRSRRTGHAGFLSQA